MNWSAALVALVPVGEVMVTSTVPGTVAAGALAVIEVAELTVTPEAAVVPKLTPVAPVKPVPVILTVVPPAGTPATGPTADTAGTAS